MARERRHLFWFVLSLVATAILLVAVSRPLGARPALAPLLNTSSGLWNHSSVPTPSQTLRGLKANVHVAIDPHGVPHIFADNEHDLYLAQGFLTARYRLFQMDLTTRVAAGRLSELVGEKGLAWDRYFTQFGMREYVQRTRVRLLADSSRQQAAQAYVEGVNQWIEQLDSSTLPPEYKLLGLWPEKFDEQRLANLLILMAYNLAGRTFDLEATQFRLQHGFQKSLELWPANLPEHLESFIVKDFKRQDRLRVPSPFADYEPHLKSFPSTFQPAEGNGSNNFAVGPSKSATGHSILANDTHLSFSLPNVWFETQLWTPEKNTYGVTFPMAPGIVLGFTPEVAWAVTNGTTDVLDWFEVEFRDETSLDYRWGDSWKTASRKTETLRVKNGAAETLQVIETEAGFVMKREGRWGLAARWVGSQMGEELSAIMKLNRAKNFSDCTQALEHWFVPTQNWICADAQNIGIFHRGWIPKREEGEGQFIQWADPHIWKENIPFAELPQLVNPPEGFVGSANQRVIPANAGFYMGWDYEDPVRGERIRRKLQSSPRVSAQDLIDLQNDTHELAADMSLPLMLKHLSRESLSPDQKEMVRRLEKWNRQAAGSGVETMYFKTWWSELKSSLLKDDWGAIDSPVLLPRTRLQWLLERLDQNPNDADRFWVDDQSTAQVETLDGQMTQAFLQAWESLRKKYGDNPNLWTWSHESPQFPHLLKLPGFGSAPVAADGSGQTVRANRSRHGPTYKLVVELGENLKAWSMVPGGASGDPFDREYGRFVSEWAEGQMKPVYFWRTWEEARSAAATTFDLKAEGARP